jgi:hypothetical protein
MNDIDIDIKDCCILIGNTDNKLTQAIWSQFCREVHKYLLEGIQTSSIHFVGGTSTDSPYQTFCIAFSIEDELIPRLRRAMYEIRKKYKQDSIAFLAGITDFI